LLLRGRFIEARLGRGRGVWISGVRVGFVPVPKQLTYGS